jgi:hypothetical protein
MYGLKSTGISKIQVLNLSCVTLNLSREHTEKRQGNFIPQGFFSGVHSRALAYKSSLSPNSEGFRATGI